MKESFVHDEASLNQIKNVILLLDRLKVYRLKETRSHV